MNARRLAVALAFAMLVGFCAAGPAIGDYGGDVTPDAAIVRVQFSHDQTAGLANAQPPAGSAPGARYAYRSEIHCQNWDANCAGAARACPVGAGPLHDIYRQLLVPGQPPGPWVAIGQTCFPDLVPGAARGPSMAQILDAFHRTPWAAATISIQPPGGRTLIGLDTYYQLVWSATGFEPGEIDHVDPATMGGFRVEIRPKLQALTWQFGDGEVTGPTTDLGGPYPDGTIRHAYTARGSFPVSVAVTWAGDYRVNGGPWVAINDTVTVTSPPVLLQVLEARAELINPPDRS